MVLVRRADLVDMKRKRRRRGGGGRKISLPAPVPLFNQKGGGGGEKVGVGGQGAIVFGRCAGLIEKDQDAVCDMVGSGCDGPPRHRRYRGRDDVRDNLGPYCGHMPRLLLLLLRCLQRGMAGRECYKFVDDTGDGRRERKKKKKERKDSIFLKHREERGGG